MTDDLRAAGQDIRVGDKGDAVRDVQLRLARAHEGGSPGLPADGVFGPRTLRAVRHFQRTRGLAADGVVGTETWRALTEAAVRLGDRLLWHASTIMRGDDVRELQHRLNRLGFDAGQEDGLFGSLARAAVEEFQRNVGLPVDGIAGHSTMDALRRLHRGHQSGGLGVRARQREALRQLADQGLVGTRVLIDPRRSAGDPGWRAPGGAWEADVTWEIARRVTARLAARGTAVLLSRGPRNTVPPSVRGRQANELGVDLVVSIGTNGHRTPVARGSASYYYGVPPFVSEGGLRLAELIQETVVGAGWRPDCGVHPMTWAILRETRMPAVVVEPGFLTSPEDAAALTDPIRQDALAAAIARGIGRFLEAPSADSVLTSAAAALPQR
ncbi:MAG: N-acetylmuramoyl-L-alanine amidase [Nitriliruptorales bacterium]|nr:N-acetylmuramoyl-L-alanine amidase [Nitriliruptorales bacterium]